MNLSGEGGCCDKCPSSSDWSSTGALEPEDHADLRSQAEARDVEYCRADFDLTSAQKVKARIAYFRAAKLLGYPMAELKDYIRNPTVLC